MLDSLTNAQGERLEFTYHPGASGSEDLVVLGHGVTANKDRPWLVALAERFAASGVPALRFSFAGNGGSEGRFEDATISKEVEDLGAVLGTLPPARVTYVGHSMGGAVGVLRAARDERIRFLVSLAGMVHTRDFAERKFGELRPGEDVMWEKPECPLSQAFVDDLSAIGDVLPAAAEVRVPWLLVHGTADTVVPPRDARDALEASQGRAELVELPEADHVFSDTATPRMCGAVLDWWRRTAT